MDGTSINNELSNICSALKKRIKKYRFTHNASGEYYGKLYQRLSIPTIVLTGLASMGGFLSSSEILSDDTKNAFTISIGVLGSCSTIIQAILHSCEFETKKEMFEKAADAYDILLTRLECGCVNKTNDEIENLISEIETEIIKIKTDCKYLPPISIIERWRNFKKNASQSEFRCLISTHEEPLINYNEDTIIDIADQTHNNQNNNQNNSIEI